MRDPTRRGRLDRLRRAGVITGVITVRSGHRHVRIVRDEIHEHPRPIGLALLVVACRVDGREEVGENARVVDAIIDMINQYILDQHLAPSRRAAA